MKDCSAHYKKATGNSKSLTLGGHTIAYGKGGSVPGTKPCMHPFHGKKGAGTTPGVKAAYHPFHGKKK